VAEVAELLLELLLVSGEDSIKVIFLPARLSSLLPLFVLRLLDDLLVLFVVSWLLALGILLIQLLISLLQHVVNLVLSHSLYRVLRCHLLDWLSSDLRFLDRSGLLASFLGLLSSFGLLASFQDAFPIFVTSFKTLDLLLDSLLFAARDSFAQHVFELVHIFASANGILRDLLSLGCTIALTKVNDILVVLVFLLQTSALHGSHFLFLIERKLLLLLHLHLSFEQLAGVFNGKVDDEASVARQLHVVQVADSKQGHLVDTELNKSKTTCKLENLLRFGVHGGLLLISQHFHLLDQAFGFGKLARLLLFVIVLELLLVRVAHSDQKFSELCFVEVSLRQVPDLKTHARD